MTYLSQETNYTVFQSKLTSTESASPRSSARGKGPRDAVERYAAETGALELEDGEVSRIASDESAAEKVPRRSSTQGWFGKLTPQRKSNPFLGQPEADPFTRQKTGAGKALAP